MPGPLYAALDLGTNNCRLLVARPQGDGFRVVDAFSRIVRLGEKLGETGTLQAEAMDRALAALRICAGKLDRGRVARYRGVATEACRRARNGEDFLARVRSETGLMLEVIAPEEEAALALASCEPLLDQAMPHAILFDIGGGSTEVLWVAREPCGRMSVIEAISMPCGVVSFSERFGGDRISCEAYAQMVDEVATRLDDFIRRHAVASAIAQGRVQMLGTSGTVTTLAGIRMRLPRYDRSVVDGCFLDVEAIEHVSRSLAELDWGSRAAQPCIGAERADLVVAGCAILAGILRVCPIGRLRVADRGLREGILLGLMRPGAVAPPAYAS